MRVLILNQYTPPDISPTAQLVGDVAGALREEGHAVVVAGADQDYGVRAKGKLTRAWREAKALGRLFLKGLRAGPVDVIFSTSSPPGLLLVASVLSRLKGARSAHWALDLYPELAFVLGGGVPGPIRELLYGITGACYRSTTQTVTLDADMRDWLRKRYRVNAAIVRPWLLQDLSAVPDRALAYPPRDPFVWMYSGNLGQAHEWETLLQAQQILERSGCPVTLVFQGSGASRVRAVQRAKDLGLQRVEWRPYAPENAVVEALLAAHVLVVTQKVSVKGLLWPSKLGLLACLPRPIVFVGPHDGAIAAELAAMPDAGVFRPGAADALAAHVESLRAAWPPAGVPALRPGHDFAAAWSQLRPLLVAAEAVGTPA